MLNKSHDLLINGDCLEELKRLPDNSVDAIVTDPPAGISFMGKEFDHDKGGRDNWVAWLAAIMAEAYRVLKPGGHGLVWSLPRTSHWTALALEDAGFEIRDNIYHIFGSGFPKSLDVSKALDKLAGAERETWEVYRNGGGGGKSDHIQQIDPSRKSGVGIASKPASEAAKQYSGYGSALKPAIETWWLIRKPLAEKSIAANVLKHGTGAINIDACRIGVADNEPNKRRDTGGYVANKSMAIVPNAPYNQTRAATLTTGRFPSHLLLSHSIFCGEECAEDCPIAEMDRQSGNRKSGARNHERGELTSNGNIYYPNIRSKPSEYQASEGGASRYFQQFRPEAPFIYAPKASRKERSLGCEELPVKDSGAPMNSRCSNCGRLKLDHETSKCKCDIHLPLDQVSRYGATNNHPTVKSQQLMRYLVRLICQPGGTVLDPFGGSGSTAIACISEGMHYILIEKEAEYYQIAAARIRHASGMEQEAEDVA